MPKEFDLRQVDRAFKRMSKASANLSPFWREIRPAFKKSQKAHIDAKKNADGSPWAPLSRATLADRISRGGSSKKFYKNKKRGLKKKFRKRLGKVLSKKFTSRVKTKIKQDFIQLTGSGSKDRSHVHQTGGKVGRRGKSRLPAREYIFVDDAIAKLVVKKLRGYMAEAFDGK